MGLRGGDQAGRKRPRLTPRRCRSSVVEHPLGKGEVESSIPSGSTSLFNESGGLFRFASATACPPRANRRRAGGCASSDLFAVASFLRFVQKGFGGTQIGGLKALGEAIVDWCEELPGLVVAALGHAQACETEGGA